MAARSFSLTKLGLAATCVCLATIFPISQQQQQAFYSTEQFDEMECPVWMYHANESDVSSPCVCGTNDSYNILCNAARKEVYIIDGMVITYNSATKRLVAGQTLYGWKDKSSTIKEKVYRLVPRNRSKVNEFMCRRFDRTGQLCGECIKNHTPKIYSYDFDCRRCYARDRESVLFIIATFTPLTIFYVLALVFKFDANFPALHAYVLAAQIIYSPQIIRHYTVQYDTSRFDNVLIGLYGIWNLDFISSYDMQFCLSLSTLQTLALGYVMPCYTLLLIAMTYAVIEIHSRGCRVTIWIVRQFQKHFKCLKKQHNTKSSIINVFSTFLLLSYNKLISTHTDLLVFTEPFDEKGEKIGKYLYYDSASKYFQDEHLPYGILALVMATTCTILPFVILCLYPMKHFQKCLQFFRIKWHGLNIFFDSFAGCYKDGTEPGTRDCRYFAAMFLLLRISTYLTISITSITSAIALNGTITVLFMAAFGACQPYREKFAIYNKITGIILANMTAIYIVLLGIWLSKSTTTNYHANIGLWILGVLVIMPQVYIVGVTMKWLYRITCTANPESTPLLEKD